MVAASGKDAQAGLPGLPTRQKRNPGMLHSGGSLAREFGSPELSNKLVGSVWSTRAWTFQEGLMSRRAIYFTD
jgi:hypothetical protein